MRKQRPFSFGALPAAQPVAEGRSAGEIFGLPATDFFKVLAPALASVGGVGALLAYASGNTKLGALLGASTALGTAVFVFTEGYAEKHTAYQARIRAFGQG